MVDTTVLMWHMQMAQRVKSEDFKKIKGYSVLIPFIE